MLPSWLTHTSADGSPRVPCWLLAHGTLHRATLDIPVGFFFFFTSWFFLAEEISEKKREKETVGGRLRQKVQCFFRT